MEWNFCWRERVGFVLQAIVETLYENKSHNGSWWEIKYWGLRTINIVVFYLLINKLHKEDLSLQYFADLSILFSYNVSTIACDAKPGRSRQQKLHSTLVTWAWDACDKTPSTWQGQSVIQWIWNIFIHCITLSTRNHWVLLLFWKIFKLQISTSVLFRWLEKKCGQFFF